MGAAAGAAASLGEALEFLGSDSSPVMVYKAQKQGLRKGLFVAIDEEQVGRRDQDGAFAQDVTVKVGVIRSAIAAPGHNTLEYTIKVEENHTEVVRRRHLQALRMPELIKRGIPIGPMQRDVAVEIEWQGGAKFLAELVRREKGMYSVRFKSGKKEILSGVPLDHLHPVDETTRTDSSPETLAPDPLWLLDRKIQQDIDVKWPMKRRIAEALELLRSQMRPPGAPPLRGPFVGQRAFDSEGYPAHPAPLEGLTVDGAFVDEWGKFAGKIKFATTYKIGPRYPRMDAWVDNVDAGEPLYFHAALPVYAGLICLGMYKNPGEQGQGQPEWVRASDVALVGIALYVNGELCTGIFRDPPLEKNGLQKYGHDSCHFIPGCASTYMADSAWVGGVFCLAPTDTDSELRDDVYTVQAYHQLLRDWAKRPCWPATGPREIDVQVNLVLSTNYLANLRQVCAGSVRVTLSEKGLAVAYDRLKDVQERRLNSQAAHYPKRPRKALSEITYEDGVEQRLIDPKDVPGYASKAPPLPAPAALAPVVAQPTKPMARVPPAAAAEPAEPALRSMRSLLEDQYATVDAVPPPPPPAKGKKGAVPPTTPAAAKGAFMVAGTATPLSTFNGPSGMGTYQKPIQGPDVGLREILERPPPEAKRKELTPFSKRLQAKAAPPGSNAGGTLEAAH